MPLDTAQRHQIEQDAITGEWEAHRLAACDAAIALMCEITSLEKNDDSHVIHEADTNGHDDLVSRTSSFLAVHDQLTNAPCAETQTIILTAGAQRPDNIAMPLPEGLAGAAAKMAERRWHQDVDANLRRGEPL